jgi:hypothetical protein
VTLVSPPQQMTYLIVEIVVIAAGRHVSLQKREFLQCTPFIPASIKRARSTNKRYNLKVETLSARP